MNDPISVFQCGSQSPKCKCRCGYPEGTCEHKWDGPWVEEASGASVTCSRCGMLSMQHDMWVMA